MIENAIIQMVNVQPDLMSDVTPLSATESVINSIPSVCLSQQDVGKAFGQLLFFNPVPHNPGF